MDILTEFDELQAALKKVRMDEDVMVYRYGMLAENQQTLSQIKKILECPEMIACHQYLYDCDPENLTEDEITKIDKLFTVAKNRGYIDDTFNDELQADECPTVIPEEPAAEPVETPTPYIPCWTVLYTAMDANGNEKCGECYSNSISVQAARADAIAKLSRIGYQNIQILAIETGDSVNCQCNAAPKTDAPVQTPDIKPVTAPAENSVSGELIKEKTDDVKEDDVLKNRPHNMHKPATFAEAETDAALTTAEFAGESTEFDSALEFFGEAESCALSEEEFQSCLAENSERMPDNAFFNIPIAEDDEKKDDSADKSAETNDAPVDTADAPAEPAEQTEQNDSSTPAADDTSSAEPEQSTDVSLDAPAGEPPAETTSDNSSEDTPPAAEPSDEKSDDSDEEKSDDSADEEKSDDTTDDKSDEEKSDDKSDEEKSDDKSDDATEEKTEELDDTTKAELKDKYSTAFTNTMKECGFDDRSFSKLSLDEKIKFFEALKKNWTDSHEAFEFMSDNQIKQLENVVVTAK